uniref:BTB domain-containing protein n=1 Tax=Ditylenchus dipsaci TaxID=166011 RepID=A0A915E3T1_9BILA
MTNPDEKDRNSTSPGDTPTTSNSNIKERRHSSSDDGCKPVDGLSASLTKACSMTPIEDISVREGPSTSGLLASSAVENRDESKSENKSRSQNLSSSGLKAASTACANFYKLATSELDSSEDLALPTLNELSSLGTGHNKVSQQPCANQHQLSADRTSSSCYKISSDTRDRQSNGVDKENPSPQFDANQEETGHADNAVKEIELIDVEQKALETLLIFLYTDKVSIYPDSVMAVLYSAKKYGIPALEQHCVDFLKYNLSPENAFMLLGQARLFDEPQLMDMCLAVIDRDTNEAIQAEGFTDVDHQTLCSVLKRDSLRIDELPLFQALVKWSMEECKRKYMPITPENQREVLGCIVSLVRYNQMSVQEFAEHVVLSKLLTDSEIVSIFLYFTLNNVGGGPVATAQRLPIPS